MQATLWDAMEPEAFGADGPATLFDASTMARSADACGTPDMFADAEQDDPAPAPAPLPAPGTRVRVPRRGGAIGTVVAKDPVGAWLPRATGARPTVSIKFDGAGFGLNWPEDVEVLDEPAWSVPVWVRTCDRVGCILTAPHKHGTVTRTGSYCTPEGVESGTVTH